MTVHTTVSKNNGSSMDLEAIAREAIRRLASQQAAQQAVQTAPVEKAELELVRRNGFVEMPILIGISVRHVHLCQEHVEILFGKGHNLGAYQELYQKGYYAAREQLMVVGRRRCIETVRVLGPTRPYSQVELAQTDALQLGIKLPIATEGSDPACKPVTLVGPEGTVNLTGGGKGGAFIARRHMHMSDESATQLGVKAGDLLDVRIDGPRPATLHGVLVRTNKGWRNEIHLDTDEGNAVGIRSGQMGTLLIPDRG
jgi:putative phosphotransacetylase